MSDQHNEPQHSPEPPLTPLTTRMPTFLVRRLRIMSALLNRSQQSILIDAVRSYLHAHETEVMLNREPVDNGSEKP